MLRILGLSTGTASLANLRWNRPFTALLIAEDGGTLRCGVGSGVQKPAGGPLPGGRWWWVAGGVFAVVAVLSASGHVPGTASESSSAVNTAGAFHGDDIMGTRGPDVLQGKPGSDILFAFGGSDRIYGGDGSDLIDAGNGEDSVNAGPGDDRIRALDGSRDVVNCGSGFDTAFVDPSDVVAECEETIYATDMSSPATPDPPTASSEGSYGSGAGQTTGTVAVTDEPWVCEGPVDMDLVKVTMHRRTTPLDAVSISKDCSGVIRRIEVDTWSGDGIKVQNAAPVAHDLVIESGYVRCYDKTGPYHQDGIQAMGGFRITFRHLRVDCGRPGVNANFFVARGGAEASTPTDIVFEDGYLGPDAAHTILLADAVRSGIKRTIVCPGRYFDFMAQSTAIDPVDTQAKMLHLDDPRC